MTKLSLKFSACVHTRMQAVIHIWLLMQNAAPIIKRVSVVRTHGREKSGRTITGSLDNIFNTSNEH